MSEEKRIIKIVPYDKNWVFKFKNEIEFLYQVLNNEIVEVHHIGSTSIPGMCAKPTIDILIEVKDIKEIDKYVLGMASLGYKNMGEYGIPDRQFFYKGEIEREFHVHIYQSQNPEIERHINFRDYLICHAQEASEYANLKLKLAENNELDIEKYMDGKDKFIKNIDKKATIWKRSLDIYIIKTQRLGLRHWQDSDYLPFSQINGDPQVMEFFPKVLTEDESNSMVDKLKNHFEKHRFGAYAVEDIVTKQFIGCVGLNIPDFEADFTPCVEILWRIGTKFWGKSYAPEAAKACLEYAFEKLDFEEIVSFTSIFNKRSERVMLKIGMKKQGEFMHPKLPEDHKLSRHVLYKISKSEFITIITG